MDDPVRDRAVVGINCERPLCNGITRDFFNHGLQQAGWQAFISDERFDGGAEWEAALEAVERSVRKPGATI